MTTDDNLSTNASGQASGRPKAARPSRLLFLVLGTVLLLVGLALSVGGLQLVLLGGSPYYLVAGAGLALSGLLTARRDVRGAWLFAIVYAGTVAWALWEAGLAVWPLVPRLAPFLVMGIVMAILYGLLEPRRRRPALAAAALQVAVMVAGVAAMSVPIGAIYGSPSLVALPLAGPAPVGDAAAWQFYGRDSGATHFGPFEQVNQANVDKLKVAWTFRTGEINETADFEATPIQIGDTLYFCTAHNRIFALDADTGQKKWSFDPKVTAAGPWNRCRGVSYFSTSATPAPGLSAPAGGDQPCAARIIATTVDARLLALDARTGTLCPDFGKGGVVDLTRGMGPMKPDWYYQTSAPLVARGHVIVGGWVSDNQSTDEPGGVVRAFDAKTGALRWAWDPGLEPGTPPPSAEAIYTRSTPNFWGTATFDDKLGLIYVPTGSGTPDHWGGKRAPGTDKYSTSVIALKVDTGEVAWHFQTVHHDLWDWDLSAPPTFVDMPVGNGRTVPALVQVGKAGQIFVLDRRTGQPITKVEERPVPQGAMPGDRLSPTQPYSVGMPQVIPFTLSERTMWGATFFDQLACRIKFRKMHFEGQYTPPSLTQSPISPGYLGGMNWGGVAIDPRRNMLIVNDIRFSTLVRLIPSAELTDKDKSDVSHASYEVHPQKGAPYGVELSSFLSPLGLPCEQPSWGMITGIDLKTRKIAWQIPAGTLAEEMGKMTGIHAPFPTGMPTLSSALVTSSGLTFYAGTNDAYLRAWDTATGKLLWKDKLPVGAQATPMTHVSPKSGRQFVLVAAGGAPYSPKIGDYVIAYALP